MVQWDRVVACLPNLSDAVALRSGWYPMTDIWRTLGWTTRGQAEIEAWKVKAAVLGLSKTETGTLWNEVIADQTRWPWPFNALNEANRRLMLRTELRDRPTPQMREAGERILASTGLPYTPATVDEYGWMLERMATE